MFEGAKPHLVSDAHAEHTRKELMHMLSMCITSWRICSGYASVPDVYAQLVLKGLRSVYELVPDAYAPVPDLYAQCTYQLLMRMLSIRRKVGAYT